MPGAAEPELFATREYVPNMTSESWKTIRVVLEPTLGAREGEKM